MSIGFIIKHHQERQEKVAIDVKHLKTEAISLNQKYKINVI